MQISKYFASLGISVDRSSIKRVDSTLDRLENRLRRLGTFGSKPIPINIGKFDVDQKKLNIALGNALDIASKSVVFEISRFVVNDRNLQAALLRAARRLPVPPGGGGPLPPLPPGGGPRPPVPLPPGSRQRGSTSLLGGGLGGLYGSALTLGFGAYGLAALNRKNQQVVSAELQSSAVVQQAGGTAQQGKDSFQYLKSEGQRIGFNYLDASQDYNKLISGLTGSGIGLKESQKVFSGFAELARVNKLDKTTQNRLFRALSQVAGKGKLMSEELTGQIAEALPGGTALFAQAYQAKIGGNKTGSEAIQQLLADMKKGKVTSDILTYAGAAASQRANQGGALGYASQASQAEQARYQNSVNDMAVIASGAGVEEGFARIFRTLNAGLSESGDLVKSLAEGFNEATKWADDLILFPQSFARALEGKDSLVGDWLGIDKTQQLISDWKEIKGLWEQIGAIKPSDLFGTEFLPNLKSTAEELRLIMEAISKFKRWNENAAAAADTVQADIASRGDGPISNFFAGLGGSIAGLSAYVSTPFDVEESNQYKDYVENEYARGAQSIKAKEQLTGIFQNLRLSNFDPLSGAREQNSFNSDALSSEFGSQQAAMDADKTAITNNSNQIDITVNVDGSTLQGMDANAQAQAIGEAVANMFVQSFDQVNVQFPVKQ